MRLSRLDTFLSTPEVRLLLRQRRTARQSTNPEEFVDLIDGAIRKGRKIEIWYTAVGQGEIRRIISPLGWQAKGSLIYICSYNNHGNVRTYRLDRMAKVKETWTKALTGYYSPYVYPTYDSLPEVDDGETDSVE